jgi:hypothetical protein
MNDENHKSGERYEIIVLKVNRNHEGTVKELYALADYFKKKGNDYSVLNSSYGSPSKALKKTIAWYLDSKNEFGDSSLKHPKKTLYEINKMFMERKLVTSGTVSDMGVQADVEKLISSLAHFFGSTVKKAEDVDELD